jgi:hypothetical protein
MCWKRDLMMKNTYAQHHAAMEEWLMYGSEISADLKARAALHGTSMDRSCKENAASRFALFASHLSVGGFFWLFPWFPDSLPHGYVKQRNLHFFRAEC